MKLTTLLNNAKLASIKYKIYIFIALVFIALIIACILILRANNNAKNEVEIENVTEAKEITKDEVNQWNKQIDDHNKEFTETQKDLSDKAKEIRKNTKPNKLPNYEKPAVKDASYNAMLDSLLVAMPN
jgi:septal ring factor EnvC (AmiA/AmiB activator)